ncbi:hypothetical protein BaRGS_00001675, partial [Batillaria attramentaria]
FHPRRFSSSDTFGITFRCIEVKVPGKHGTKRGNKPNGIVTAGSPLRLLIVVEGQFTSRDAAVTLDMTFATDNESNAAPRTCLSWRIDNVDLKENELH